MNKEKYERFISLFQEQIEHMDYLSNSKESFDNSDIAPILVGIRRMVILRDILFSIPKELISDEDRDADFDSINDCLSDTIASLSLKYPLSAKYMPCVFANLDEFLNEYLK